MTALPDSEYAAMIRNGFDNLARRLDQARAHTATTRHGEPG